MATVQPIGSVTSATGTSSAATSAAAGSAAALSGGLNANMFMKMFTSELANQDPMNPMDSTQFLNQFSQITQVQSIAQLTQSLGNFQNTMSSMLNASTASQGVGLLGHQVKYTDAQGNAASGTVSAMNIASDGSVQLNINGTAVGINSITQVN